MSGEVKLKWHYTPPDYFEEPVCFEIDQVRVEIEDGRITACLPATVYDQNEGIRDEISNYLRSFFLGAQITDHKPYQLSGAKLHRTDASGKEEVSVFLKAHMSAVTVTGLAHLQITDADGNVVGDTKADRIAHRHRIAELAAKHAPTDPTVRGMLQSYHGAMEHPDNELVYLYEMRDALGKRFKGKANAQQALDITERQWKALGRLACDEPVHQGRHRGQQDPDKLRDATADELQKARTIASQMFQAYLIYLDGLH